MGACASVPKGLKAEDGAAPPPEPPKEEITTPKAAEVKAEEGENKVDGAGDDKPKNADEVVAEEKVAEDSDKHQSLNTLMNDQGEAKEESLPASTGSEAVPPTAVKAEEDKAEPPPVYDSPPKKDESEKPSTDIAEANKSEETTQK